MASWIRFGVVWVVCVGLTVLLGIPADGAQWAGIPVLWWCFALAFLVQWVAFVPAYLKQTEHFFDLTGSLTYLAVMVGSLGLSALERPPGPAQWLVSAAVTVWAVRLGTFLFRRVKADGGDGRFDDLKPSVPKFLIVWTLQAAWVSMTALAMLLVNTGSAALQRPWLLALGAVVWVFGFTFEVVADRQKRVFRRDPTQAGRFIQSGLWGWSQHPNYFGEIVLWTGVFVMSASVVDGWGWRGAISPVFVAVLLLKVSGVPLLQARGEERWGDDPEYRRYRATVPVLIPRPPRHDA